MFGVYYSFPKDCEVSVAFSENILKIKPPTSCTQSIYKGNTRTSVATHNMLPALEKRAARGTGEATTKLQLWSMWRLQTTVDQSLLSCQIFNLDHVKGFIIVLSNAFKTVRIVPFLVAMWQYPLGLGDVDNISYHGTDNLKSW